jgi:hypothetical protein
VNSIIMPWEHKFDIIPPGYFPFLELTFALPQIIITQQPNLLKAIYSMPRAKLVNAKQIKSLSDNDAWEYYYDNLLKFDDEHDTTTWTSKTCGDNCRRLLLQLLQDGKLSTKSSSKKSKPTKVGAKRKRKQVAPKTNKKAKKSGKTSPKTAKKIKEGSFVFQTRTNSGPIVKWEVQATNLVNKLLEIYPPNSKGKNTKILQFSYEPKESRDFLAEKKSIKKVDSLADYGFKQGDIVTFGSPLGERTEGKVICMARNTKLPKIRIESLQKRGLVSPKKIGTMFSIVVGQVQKK